MKLSENQAVVDVLKRILENYDYLEYDEGESRKKDFLYVVVKGKCLDPNLKKSDPDKIVNDLRKKTDIQSLNHTIAGNGGAHWDTEWSHFIIRTINTKTSISISQI